ncbi:MerR family transcriptional regulator [Mycolicibacterium goodii]|uniref:MerR family transcriptional regulator n=1 Tax=Mycolicibacterium goodii TaxID=134601 RepID=UPI001BDD5D66|nr:MerR family transcriptional regulator [Mycolicibacterium goodii]MBU8829748.1 MerR family transcriptional regulator [Mycolicibacterium goodii]
MSNPEHKNRRGPGEDELIGIGAAARRFGIAESALRYWERRGLLQPAQRRSRWRLYGSDQLHRIGLIHLWRETGLMNVDEIGKILNHSHDWRRAVQERIQAIDDQQRRLTTARTHLEHLLECPDANPATECPVLREMSAERSRPDPR